ncbi:maestro heat-like repeat-containing protein family member 7 [Ciconia boyciana]|uniref:maestro heat-like repeat-containing protein family member 7 n=1 Tax=Ciconia boyciana TaxID=52775 RepID=UPI003BA0B518
MSRGARAGAPVRRARVSLRPLAHRTPRARVFRHGPTVPTRTASRSPRRRRAPRAAEDKRPGVAAEDHQQSESPRQGELRSEDLGSASPVVEAEEGESPGIPDPSAAGPASSCQLEDEEKEAHDYFSVFLNGTEREEASKLRFLASICTLCRAWLQGRYRPGFRSARELVEKMEVLRQKQLPRSMDAAMWQQAVLAVAAMSKENQDLLDQHLGPCIHSTFCLAPAQSQDSQHASLDAQILKTLDSVLEVLTRDALQVKKILQILLPFTASQEVARRRKAVGRIVCLSRFLTPSSMLEVSRFREGNFFLFQAKPLQFLGQLMGHLTLSRAEKDQEISCGAAEALRAVHRFILLREACYAAREDPKLRVERERPSTLWAEEPADEATVFGRFLFQTERSSFLLTVLRGIVHPRVSDVQLIASVLEAVLRYPCSELNKVEEVVWTIHAQLACVSQKPLEDILMKTLLQVALLYPQRVTAGLLQASPCCDSTARAMWSSLASEPCLGDDVLKTLLQVQQKIGQQCSIAGERSYCVFLAVAGAMHEIFLLPSSRCCVQLLLGELFMAVVFQVSFSLSGPQQGCCSSGSQSREAKCPPVHTLRSAVRTMQALFRCLGGGASLVEDIARQGAWDMLMSPETYHTGIAVLTRVLRREVPACCVAASQEAVRVLLQRQAYQDIGAMTVFVELLDCTDFEHVTGQVLHVLQLHLQSKSVVLRRMAITSLVTLSARPQEAATLQGLLPAVVQRLQDDDCDVTVAALAVLGNMLCLEDRPMAVSIALQLVETLPPLFENESSCVRARSILLWRDAMEVAVSTHKEQMRRDVQRSLLPLFFHLHDRDDSVAQASRETLLGAAKFLKRRQLRKLLETEQTWRVSECLLVEDSSGAEEYLQQSLPYLQSPQEPLREAAVRFTGLAGRQLRDGRQEKLRVIYEALRGKVNDSSLSVSSLALQTLMILDAAVKEPPSAFRLQALCYRLRKAWRRRTLAPGAGWLCCWSCVQS